MRWCLKHRSLKCDLTTVPCRRSANVVAAAQAGNANELEHLLLNNANPLASNAAGVYALAIAAERGHTPCVALLDDLVNEDARSIALIYAAAKNRVDCAEILLRSNEIQSNCKNRGRDRDIDVNFVHNNETPLMAATSRGHICCATLILNQRGVDIDRCNWDGDVALTLAVRARQLASVELLVRRSASVNIQNSVAEGSSALMIACEQTKDVSCIVVLLEAYNLDFKLSNPYESLLTFACRDIANVTLVKKIMENVLRVKIDCHGMHCDLTRQCVEAAECNNVPLMWSLIHEFGANPSGLSDMGRTPLMVAIEKNHLVTVDFLLGLEGMKALAQYDDEDDEEDDLYCCAPSLCSIEEDEIDVVLPWEESEDWCVDMAYMERPSSAEYDDALVLMIREDDSEHSSRDATPPVDDDLYHASSPTTPKVQAIRDRSPKIWKRNDDHSPKMWRSEEPERSQVAPLRARVDSARSVREASPSIRRYTNARHQSPASARWNTNRSVRYTSQLLPIPPRGMTPMRSASPSMRRDMTPGRATPMRSKTPMARNISTPLRSSTPSHTRLVATPLRGATPTRGATPGPKGSGATPGPKRRGATPGPKGRGATPGPNGRGATSSTRGATPCPTRAPAQASRRTQQAPCPHGNRPSARYPGSLNSRLTQCASPHHGSHKLTAQSRRMPSTFSTASTRAPSGGPRNSDFGALMARLSLGVEQSAGSDRIQESKFKIDVNVRSPGEQVSALMLAAQLGRSHIVPILLEQHADINMRNREGNTALHLACERGKVACVRALLNANADVNVVGRGGTPLHVCASAAHNMSAECVCLLLGAKARKDIVCLVDDYHVTAYQLACGVNGNGNAKMFKKPRVAKVQKALAPRARLLERLVLGGPSEIVRAQDVRDHLMDPLVKEESVLIERRHVLMKMLRSLIVPCGDFSLNRTSLEALRVLLESSRGLHRNSPKFQHTVSVARQNVAQQVHSFCERLHRECPAISQLDNIEVNMSQFSDNVLGIDVEQFIRADDDRDLITLMKKFDLITAPQEWIEFLKEGRHRFFNGESVALFTEHQWRNHLPAFLLLQRAHALVLPFRETMARILENSPVSSYYAEPIRGMDYIEEQSPFGLTSAAEDCFDIVRYVVEVKEPKDMLDVVAMMRCLTIKSDKVELRGLRNAFRGPVTDPAAMGIILFLLFCHESKRLICQCELTFSHIAKVKKVLSVLDLCN